jgi:transcriptional regulator GlxA family with amidase domain
MANLIVVAIQNSYLCSLGVLVDAHARLSEMFPESALDPSIRLHTGLQLLTPGPREPRLAGGRRLMTDGGIEDAIDPALVYLPNFQISTEDLGAFAARDTRLLRWVAEMARGGAPICASGASVWIAAAAGLLNERRAAVDVRHAAAFRRAFPKVEVDLRDHLTTDAPIMTCASEILEPDFAIRAIDRAMSPGAALWLALRRGGAADSEVSDDPLVARAQLLIRERFKHDLSIEQLAADLSVSHQTLIRRFRRSLKLTPRAYLQQQRLSAAAASLRETRRTVAEIAALVGYADLPSFRAAFHAYAGMTPAEYRTAHARPAWSAGPEPSAPMTGAQGDRPKRGPTA